ncbi:MBL fold metallo-hydrolase [Aquibacillus koreensis]|uniref:MBL fold metallo-hydrolase n=1 Tax=Aquibacillus koreensis TaxID=279446 RepID=A0A9X3WP29_9BACI|nr:MBL fold metallo-hydrolase [Aquibacillus koreensis]MCT2534409.1 MBL fold metallo-hydrolase [Aquibacillus koreensis]MDC3421716.1 MBL fold metallo-hydrolase [Aquibacillus koreensis]
MRIHHRLMIGLSIWIVVLSICTDALTVIAIPIDDEENLLQVHFINVGQGDSMLIETPEGKNILIDGGPPAAGDKVVNYLKQQDITTLDLVIATHPDIDHIGGLVEVIKQVEVKNIVDSGKLHHTLTYFEYLKQIKQQKIPTTIARESGEKEIEPELSLQVLNDYGIFKGNNESSIAIQLSYKEIDFLLMSDVETKQEMEMIKKYDLESEIFKVAHHGSDTSTSEKLLEEVRPEKAILSYSVENDYGHPVGATVDKLLEAGATIYSTARSGDIVIGTDGYNYRVEISGKDRIIQHRFG